jgi:hypothetical protein
MPENLKLAEASAVAARALNINNILIILSAPANQRNFHIIAVKWIGGRMSEMWWERVEHGEGSFYWKHLSIAMNSISCQSVPFPKFAMGRFCKNCPRMVVSIRAEKSPGA